MSKYAKYHDLECEEMYHNDLEAKTKTVFEQPWNSY